MKGSGRSRAVQQERGSVDRKGIGRRRYVGGLRLVGIGGRGTAMSKHSRHYMKDGELVGISFTSPTISSKKETNRRRNKAARKSRKANRGR